MDLTASNAADEIAKAIETLPDKPTDLKWGRGIVIAAGGTGLSINAWVNVRMLRRHGCTLPVEVWHLGPDEYSQSFAALMTPYDVTFIDAFSLLDKYPHQRLNGWELKPYAVAHSSYEEVMFLDADNMAIRDPTYLLEDERYKKVGSMFWPDFGRLEEGRKAWEVFGVEYRDEPEFESGQICLNKSVPGVWKCLELCNWLMQNSNNFFFDYVHGDKEIFHMSWRRLNQPFVMTPEPLYPLDGVMCQHDLDGRRVFQHRNMRKWNFDDNPETPGFDFEDECRELVSELRRYWTPASDRPANEDDAKRIEHAAKRYAYIRIHHDCRVVELRPDGTIGEGAAERERFWTIRGDRMVVVGDDGVRTMELRPWEHSSWRGKWLVHEQMPVALIPVQ